MRIHCLQHVPFEKTGVIGPWARSNHHVLTTTKLFREPTFPDPSVVDFLLVLGGPMGANDEVDYPWLSAEKRFIEECLEESTTILGICLGAQLIASVLGADVYKAKYHEVGWYPIELTPDGLDHPFFQDWPEEPEVFHWHGDTFDLPEGSTRIASSQGCENQAFVHDNNVIGLQFHVELTRDNIEYMLEFLEDDMPRGPYAQTANEIRNELDRTSTVNTLAIDLLDALPLGQDVETTTD